jgi:hypothetical protein
MAILGGFGVAVIIRPESWTRIFREGWMRRTLPAAVLLILCIQHMYFTQRPLGRWLWEKSHLLLPGYVKIGGHPAELRVAARVREWTGPDDSIQIFGNSVYYWLADRPPACRFLYYVPVLRKSPIGTAYARDLEQTLRERKPALVLVAEGIADEPGLPEILRALPENYRRIDSMEADYLGRLDFWERKD